MHLMEWLRTIVEQLEAKADEDRLSWDEKLMIRIAYECFRLYRWFDESVWRLETWGYQLDTALFPMPESKKGETLEAFYLRIPARLAKRELIFSIKRWDRQMNGVDIENIIATIDHSRDKKAYKDLWDTMGLLREQYVELYRLVVASVEK